MQAHSHIISTLDQGLVLDVVMGELGFTAYIVVSEPDLDLIPSLIPKENYDSHGSLHVTAISTAHEAQEQISDIAFNMDQGDAAVFLCRDRPAYLAALHELGQHNTPSFLN